MNSTYEQLIDSAYSAFNARNIDRALICMHKNVEWPKAFEGGYVQGHEAIRDYWTRQWKEINPTVKPLEIKETDDGKLIVTVHQYVEDLDGAMLFDGEIKHTYTLEDSLLRRMDISTE